MFNAVDHPTLVRPDKKLVLAERPTTPPKGAANRKGQEKLLEERVDAIRRIQRKLYADNRHAVLFVFQAMDAAGKDSTIRKVFSGVNPAGFQVRSFGRPSSEELDHDFLWRTTTALPERGRIGVFNRSYYEEVLVVRVHPGILVGQRLPEVDEQNVWGQRFESIVDFEKHLARNGTTVVKFFLHVSREEQKRRLLARLDDPKKNWKFEGGDLRERALWPKYESAYEQAMKATSRSYAPWYTIPADDKPFMRATVADIVLRTIESLDLSWPQLDDDEKAQVPAWRKELGKS